MIRCIFISALLVALGACTAIGLYPRQYELSRDALERKLAERLPFKRTYFAIVDIELANPRVGLEPATNRIAATFDTTVRVPFASRPYEGTLALSGMPRYDIERRAVMVDAPRVDDLQLTGVPANIAAQLQSLADRLARDALATQPLYALRDEDLKFGGTTLEPQAVRVDTDRLVVTLQPRAEANSSQR